MKQKLTEEFQRMQKLAGIVIENQLTEESYLKQLELTDKGEFLLKYLNSDIENDKPENYHLSSRDEQSLMDVQMYIDELYGENRFTDLTSFALDIASEEYQDPQKGMKNIINKINNVINKGWAKIIPYKGKNKI